MLRGIALFLLFGLAAAPVPAAETLPRPVATALNNHGLDGSGLSVFVQAVDAPEPLLAFNAEVPRSPASVIKLLTTYAALDRLGPAYRWQTEVLVTGPVRDGRLEGDLVLRGGGDPHLSTERFWTLLREIRARGIRNIGGDLVIDDTLFAPVGEDPGDFDGQPFRAYNVLPNALLVNSNTVEFRLLRDGEAVQVYVDPPLAGFQVDNRVGSRSGACGGFQRGVAFHLPDGPGGRRAVLDGRFPTGCDRYSLWRSVLPPPEFAGAVFRALWAQLGGKVSGDLRVAATPEGARLLFAYDSLPLNEQLRLINKWSNNPMTRHLLLTLGLAEAGPPATIEKGRAALAQWVADKGLAMPGLYVDNGSGLSRDTRVTAAGLGEMLLDAWQHPQMADFIGSMPIAAADGTLRRRFHGDMQGRLSLKTGRLDDVAAIAGLVQSRSGQRYVVVVILNARDAHRGIGEAVQETVLRWVFER